MITELMTIIAELQTTAPIDQATLAFPAARPPLLQRMQRPLLGLVLQNRVATVREHVL